MSDDVLHDLASKLEQLSAEDQRAVLAHLDSISSREHLAAEAAKKAVEIRLQRQIEPLENELSRIMQHPSANRERMRELRKQLEPLYAERDRLSK